MFSTFKQMINSISDLAPETTLTTQFLIYKNQLHNMEYAQTYEVKHTGTT
jgi:hypothetical protein